MQKDTLMKIPGIYLYIIIKKEVDNMANIRVLDEGTKNQRYQLNYEEKLIGTDVRKRRSKTFPAGTPLREVKAFQRKVETEYAMSTGVNVEHFDITVEAFLPYFMEHCEAQMSPSTVRTYTQAINSKEVGIKKYFGDKKLRTIKTIDIQNYIRVLEKHKTKEGKPMAPKSIINYVYIISAMFEYAMRIGYMERKTNPCQYAELPKKVPQKQIEVYTADEAKEVLQLLAQDEDIMLYFAVNLAVGCGLRRSEIAALKIQDFDFKRNILHVSRAVVYGRGKDVEKETKTESGKRSIVIPAGVSEAIHKVKKYKMKCRTNCQGTYYESDYLYVNENGKLLHVSTVTNRWLKWLNKHPEVKKISFHALRHTYCSLMLTYGIDARTLADLMGHSSASISLNVYSHSYMETKQSYVNTLNDALYVSAN